MFRALCITTSWTGSLRIRAISTKVTLPGARQRPLQSGWRQRSSAMFVTLGSRHELASLSAIVRVLLRELGGDEWYFCGWV
jgi:hypothetical protein